ncbi:hypothetical protein CGRA01v4_01244 [Colletotrichum graminicola]|nr:hypothetical protein CGRA01v4_01244 [Colletotrichum graminicola]
MQAALSHLTYLGGAHQPLAGTPRGFTPAASQPASHPVDKLWRWRAYSFFYSPFP